ncbi:MAG: outer membrane protein transport protein [Bacteroidetes bacterium]|nr:outer membrane protein transport protein [Bacteroidota bacterium]
MRKTIFTMMMTALAINFAFAGGYQVRLQGNKNTGMGLTGTALNMGSSSIFYNPGALTMMSQKLDFSLGASAILSNVTFEKSGSNYQAQTDNKPSTPFYVYGAGKINDKWVVGLGIYTPYGSASVWDDNWAGKLLIQNIALRAIFYQPTVAYKINDKIGIGAGLVYATGKVTIEKGLNYSPTSKATLEGNAASIGFNAGVYFTPTEKLAVGIDYRSKINMDVKDGDATFTLPSALYNTLPADNKFDASLPLPANLDFGVSYKASDKLLLSLELNWVMWGTYDSLKFTFKEKGELLNSSNPRLYRDSFIPRFGAQYKLNDMVCLRAGGYYDPTPTNEDYFTPETVSLNTIAFTLGLSVTPVKNLTIDLSYLQLSGMKAEKSYAPDNFSGTFKSTAAIPGLGLSYRF